MKKMKLSLAIIILPGRYYKRKRWRITFNLCEVEMPYDNNAV